MRSTIGIGVASIGAALALAACIPDEPASAPAPAKTETANAGVTADAAKGADAAPQANAAEGDSQDSKALLATVEKMKEQLKDRQRDFGVNVALGNLFYDNGRYIEALQYYRDAVNLGERAEKQLLAFAEAKKPAAKDVPQACRMVAPGGPDLAHGGKTRPFEELAKAAEDQTPADGPAAVACWRQLVPFLSQLHAREGNAWYLAGNGDKAREEHEKALSLDPDQPEALFFRGAHILETAHGDPEKLALGRAQWEHLLKVAPDHPRAQIVRETMPRIEELFGAHEAPPMAGHPSTGGHPQVAGDSDTAPAAAPAPLAPGMAEAFQNTPMTPELEKQLAQSTTDAEAALAKGQWQDALDLFKRVMPYQPSGRVATGMGVALRELGKPTAERVLTMAASMPGDQQGRAKYELGVFYEKSDRARAKSLFEEAVADPKVGAQAKAHLAKL
jgi:tetratricopeptide (TPR) repeat protein